MVSFPCRPSIWSHSHADLRYGLILMQAFEFPACSNSNMLSRSRMRGRPGNKATIAMQKSHHYRDTGSVKHSLASTCIHPSYSTYSTMKTEPRLYENYLDFSQELATQTLIHIFYIDSCQTQERENNIVGIIHNLIIALKTLQLVQVEVVRVVMVTQKHPLSCSAAEASDTQLSQVSREAGQVLPQGGGGSPRQCDDQSL